MRNAAQLFSTSAATHPAKLRATLVAVSAPGAVDLSVHVGELRLANPIVAASGTFGYGIEFAHLVDLNLLGGIVVKGLSLEPMNGAPAPRLCETSGGMLNAVGLQNVGVRAFVAEKLPALRTYRTAIVANVFGHTVEEYVEVIRVLEDAEGLAAYELNVSCPNVAQGGLQYGSDPRMTAEVVAAEAAGANALTVANTYLGMSVDYRTRRSRVGNLTGGLSGPAIKPITLRLVYEVCQVVKIPVLGLGGIQTPEDVMEYLIVGASAAQVGTAQFVDPRACLTLLRGLEKLCEEAKICNINDIRGSLDAQKY